MTEYVHIKLNKKSAAKYIIEYQTFFMFDFDDVVESFEYVDEDKALYLDLQGEVVLSDSEIEKMIMYFTDAWYPYRGPSSFKELDNSFLSSFIYYTLKSVKEKDTIINDVSMIFSKIKEKLT